jgi:hypothetical protein
LGGAQVAPLLVAAEPNALSLRIGLAMEPSW